MRFAVATAAVAALLPAAAGAHVPGTKLNGYVSKVLSVKPATQGLQVQVVQGDEKLELVNKTGKVILIYGYNDEPYLRFTPGGVLENRNSPAAYLNQDRLGQTAVPKTATPKAAPRWVRVATGTTFAWHDHRIHWMSPIPPPSVQKHSDKASHVFDWTVKAAEAGKPVLISGTLDYRPPAGSGGSSTTTIALILGGAGVLVAAATAVFARRLRRRPA